MDSLHHKFGQTTIRTPTSCSGIGLHTGAPSAITLLPAERDTGIVFRRTDVAAEHSYVAARFENVGATQMGTVLRNAAGVSVATVEHLMAALSGLGIDNCVVEVAGPEIPIMDGSAEAFVALIDRAGIEACSAPRKLVRVAKPVEVAQGDKRAALLPYDGLCFAFDIEFASRAIGRQSLEIVLTPSSFRHEVASARTFGFLEEVEELRKRGLARGGSLDNAIVVSGDRILNEGPLRFADEFVRHKVLDAMGDLALAGGTLLARYEGCRAGHELNNRLLRALFADPAAWEAATARPEPGMDVESGVFAGAGF